MIKMKLLIILLTGIIFEKTVVQSELSCDGHDLRTMMVQLLTLRQEFADFKLKTEQVIRIQNETFLEKQTQYENVIQVLNNTIRETLTNTRVLNDTIRESLTNHTKYENIIQKLNNTVELQRMNETIQEALRNYKQSNEVIQGRLSNTIQGLNDTVQVLNETIQETLKNRTKSDKISQDLNTALQETLKNHTAELLALKSSSSEMLVGFIATSLNDSVCNGILTFDTTLANNGSAYNSSDGYFTAPYEGIYLFSVQLCFDYNYYTYAAKYQIYSPTRNQFITATQYSVYNYYHVSCTSITTTTYLSKLDQIYVTCSNFNNITRSNDIDYRNMFTGVLIKANG